jgi:LemA protein
VLAVVLIAVLVVLAVPAVLLRNGVVAARNRADSSWSQVEVELKRRHDLVPNLVDAVARYAGHERAVLDETARARSAAEAASGAAQATAAETSLAGAVGRLLAVGEAYPQLRAQERFSQLVAELSATEARIAIARQVYNDTALTYNDRIQTLPTAALAWALRWHPMPYFESDGEAA